MTSKTVLNHGFGKCYNVIENDEGNTKESLACLKIDLKLSNMVTDFSKIGSKSTHLMKI